MDASEAMSVLERAGRGAEAREVVDQLATSAHAAYEQINSDDTRTADYKRDELARHYAGVREEAARALRRLAESTQAAERRDAGRVFGTDGLAGDAASLMISRRDAADRVAAATNSSELRELLTRATRSGDEVLARAVAEKAVEFSDVETMNKFLANRAHLDDAAQRLWDAARHHESLSHGLGNTMALYALRPPGAI